MINVEALHKISYGLYIVCSGDKNKGNGYVSNTVFQVSSKPVLFAACCNKNNYTAEIIQKTKAFSISVLEQDASAETIGKFGYKSGKDIDKMVGMNIQYGETGVPVLLNDSIATLEFILIQTVDVGTHLMFIGELHNAQITDNNKVALTYLYYRQVKKGLSPINAPTYIEESKPKTKSNDSLLKKYKCPACGYIYDEVVEDTHFDDLPNDWVCPVCGSEKADFFEIE
jgi:flavin reductase (DIM6/NTAB) family NADH-FMN oxidoreductase RutF/rubredoxin